MNSLQHNNYSSDIDNVIGDFREFVDRESQLEKIYQIFEIYGLGHGCLQTGKNTNFSTNALWRVTPDDVTTACSYLAKANKHPAVQLAKNRFFPFDMFDFRDVLEKDPDIKILYNAFENNSLNNAYGLPVHIGSDETYVFVIGRPNSKISTTELLCLQAVCINALNHTLKLERRPCDFSKTSKLNKGERQILILIAQGKPTAYIAEQHRLSELTINLMQKSLIQKMGASNVSQAILIAIIEGEISLSECT